MRPIKTAAYHPCANGIVEWFHKQLKTALSTKSNLYNWVNNLPLLLLSIQNVFREDIWTASSKMVFGTSLILPVK